ncbi:unknown [Roseburia sp. CAG:100]|nr:unknown [Roseburia sp. CAG:100]
MISSSLEIRRCATFSFFISARTCNSFSCAVLPVIFSGTAHTLVAGIAGLSVHNASATSFSYANFTCLSASIVSSFLPKVASTTLPSKPIVCPSVTFWSRYSSMVGTPSSAIRYRTIPEPASSFSACTKYLPSVQRPVSF